MRLLARTPREAVLRRHPAARGRPGPPVARIRERSDRALVAFREKIIPAGIRAEQRTGAVLPVIVARFGHDPHAWIAEWTRQVERELESEDDQPSRRFRTARSLTLQCAPPEMHTDPGNTRSPRHEATRHVAITQAPQGPICNGCRVSGNVTRSGVRATVRTMRIGYGRVSTHDQNAEAQHDALSAAGCEEIFIDTASGKLARRPELDKALLSANRTGDQLVVTKLDRRRWSSR